MEMYRIQKGVVLVDGFFFLVDEEYTTECFALANNKYSNSFFNTGFGEDYVNPEDIIDVEFRVKPDTDEQLPEPITVETKTNAEYLFKRVLRVVEKAEKAEKRNKRARTGIGYRGSKPRRNKRPRGNFTKGKRFERRDDGVKKRKERIAGRTYDRVSEKRTERKTVFKANRVPNGKSVGKNNQAIWKQEENSYSRHKYVPLYGNTRVDNEEEWWIWIPIRKDRKKKKIWQISRTRRAEKQLKRRLKRRYFSLRRRVYRLTKKLRDRAYIKKNKNKMHRMFRSLNVATYKQRLFLHTRWLSWLLGSTKYTMDNLNKYAGAVATVRAMIDRYFYKRLTYANLVIKNTYMNTFLTLMYKGKRVIYQQTAGQLKIYRKVRHKVFVSFVLARNLVGLFDMLRRKNRFNLVNVDVRGIRRYNIRIVDKLNGYRRYLTKSLRYYNYIFTGLERKKERIILRIFPKPFKWTNVQQQHYNHIRGQCRYFASRFYQIGSSIRRPKKPFNGCRGLELRSERSSRGIK